jgi:hypothetical protein
VRKEAGRPQRQAAPAGQRNPSREKNREEQPAGDVLQGVRFDDPRRTTQPDRPRSPTEEDAARAVWGQIHGAIDRWIAQQRIQCHLRVELTVVAAPGIVEVRNRTHRG